MAAIALQNPKLVKGRMEVVEVPSAADTWKAGEFLVATAGHATQAATGDVDLKYYALSDQDSAPSAGALIKVGLLTSDQVFEMNETAASTISDANVNIPYGIVVASNKATFDITDTTGCVRVVEIASNYNKFKYTSADTNARARVKILQSVIDA